MSELSGRFEGDTHVLPVRIYYQDTDAGGIVYHARYLDFAERGRNEMMRLLGADHPGLLRDSGVLFAVRRCEIDFRAPARLDDLLEVRTRVRAVGGASLDLEQIVQRGDTPLVTILLKLACINAAGRAVRLPAPVRAALARLAVLGT